MATQGAREESRPKDYYRILQLDPGADAALIDQAYWRLARLYNAAIPSDPTASGKLDELNEAYSVLGSPLRRRGYDASLAPEAPQDARPEPSAPEWMARLREARTAPRFWRPRMKAPKVAVARWHVVVGALSVLLLASVALLVGAGPALVFTTLLIVAVLVAGLLVPRLPLSVQPRPAIRRRARRPANLGEAAVPGGRSQALRKVVYQVYEQFPHLAAGDVRGVARYAALSRRFLRGERRLEELAQAGADGEWRRLAEEQRALAAELRRHEAALGLTAIRARSRESRDTSG